jgi:hypothetical protein
LSQRSAQAANDEGSQSEQRENAGVDRKELLEIEDPIGLGFELSAQSSQADFRSV